jgi:hypothetical protein
MVIHGLTPDECREVLGRSRHGKLACARDGQPYVVPISFYLDPEENCAYSFSAVGQKIEWMRGNPKVCLEVDEIVDQFHWTTVVAFGRYEEIPDSRQHTDARRRAHELLQGHAEWWLPGIGRLNATEGHPTSVIYRIHIDRMTGRRADRPRPGS